MGGYGGRSCYQGEARGGTHLLSGQSCFRASPVLLAHPYGISKLELRAAHAHGGAADAGHLLRRLEELLAPMACFGISARSEPRCGLMLAWVRPRLASAGLGWPLVIVLSLEPA